MEFNELFEEHKDRIYRLCTIMLHDKSSIDDLFQEVSLNIWKGFKQFRGKSKFETWMYRIIVNTSITFNTRQKKQNEKQNSFIKDKATEVHQSNENSTLLLRAIELLEDSEKTIIGFYLEGYPYQEISEILGISPSNTGVKINRIKKKLKNIIEYKIK